MVKLTRTSYLHLNMTENLLLASCTNWKILNDRCQAVEANIYIGTRKAKSIEKTIYEEKSCVRVLRVHDIIAQLRFFKHQIIHNCYYTIEKYENVICTIRTNLIQDNCRFKWLHANLMVRRMRNLYCIPSILRWILKKKNEQQ